MTSPTKSLPALATANRIYSVESVRAIDHAAIHDAGIDGYALMTRAGEAAVDFIVECSPELSCVQVVCGGGNNGGDGYVVARLCLERGIDVVVTAVTDPVRLTGDALTAHTAFVAAGGHCASWEGSLDATADLLVDALLGSGLRRNVEGRMADVVNAINRQDVPVIALDIPTGVNGDTGEVQGVAVNAEATVTFVGLKAGLFIGDGPDRVGALTLADLSIPGACYAKVPALYQTCDAEMLTGSMSPRARNSHKGDFGRVVVVGGGPGMPGAVRLAGEAALRSGAGVVSVVTHPSHAAAVVAGRPELMSHAAETPDDVALLLDRASVIGIGPGLGEGEWAERLFSTVREAGKPMVVDADALNLLAKQPQKNNDWILTPHPGEAARMLGVSAAEVQSDRRAALDLLCERYGGVVVLKGAGSLVRQATGPAWFCAAGNPGMAAPGMGDVLTGIIVSLLAQGFDAEAAAVLGVELHGCAGDAAAAAGERGLIATDLLSELRRCVNP